MARKLSDIAGDISRDWSNVISTGAYPYLKAMRQIHSSDPHCKYYLDEAQDIVIYFLANAQTWRGPIARQIKQELKQNYNIR